MGQTGQLLLTDIEKVGITIFSLSYRICNVPKTFRNIIRQLPYREGSLLSTTHRTALWISTLGTFTSSSRRIDTASLN